MAAVFASASNSLINSSSLITALPFTVGMWVNLNAVGTTSRTIFCLSLPSGDNQYYAIRMTSAEVITMDANDNTTNDFINGPTLTAGNWFFAVASFRSTNNRRFAVLGPTGTATNANSTVSVSPSTPTTITLGSLNENLNGISDPWSGLIGEFWYTNTNIEPSNIALADWKLRKLAYEGPFSLPDVAQNVLEYRGFRVDPNVHRLEDISDVYQRGVRETWANTNVTFGRHPPLASTYIRPGQLQELLVV